MSIYKTGVWTENAVKERALPEGYTELEWIENTAAGAYIDTGITPDPTVIWELKFCKTTSTVAYNGSFTTNQRLRIDNNSFGLGASYYLFSGGEVPTNQTFVVIWNTIEKYIEVDGVKDYNSSYTNFTNDISLYLFAQNNGSNSRNNGISKIYYSKIWKNGKLVRNFIPALRNVDNVPGMYDTITKTFFTNSGTGEFKYILKGVPSDYAIVDYIESTGTQWIDSGVGGIVEAKIKISSTQLTSNSSILWAENGASPWGCTGVRISSAVWQYGYGSAHTDVSTSAQINTEYVVEFTTDISNWYLKVNGAILGSGGKTDTTSSNNLYLFACNGAGTAKHFGKYKLYWCKLYQNGELIKNFIPCYRKSDNEPGLYDTVNNEFKTNSGTGAFTISSFKIETDNVKMFKNENIEANSFFEI